jgi:hypothetical protein
MTSKPETRTRDMFNRGQPLQFESVSIILPVVNEVRSLIDTVRTILQVASGCIHEIIFLLRKTTPSLQACDVSSRDRATAEDRLAAKALPGRRMQAGSSTRRQSSPSCTAMASPTR